MRGPHVDFSSTIAYPRLDQSNNQFIGYNPDEEPEKTWVNRTDHYTIPIPTARDWGHLDPKSFKGKKEVMKALRLIYTAEHCRELTTGTIEKYLMVSSPFRDEQHEMLESFKAGARTLFASYNQRAFNFFLSGVTGTRRCLEPELFDAASKQDLLAIWERLFDRAGFRVAKAMLGATIEVIDLESIIDGPHSAERIAFRAALKFLFVQGAQAICEHCSEDFDHVTQKQLERWYADWESIPRETTVRSVWTLEKLPARDSIHSALGKDPRFMVFNPILDGPIIWEGWW